MKPIDYRNATWEQVKDLVKSGKWDRDEEWTGFDSVDEYLLNETAGGNTGSA